MGHLADSATQTSSGEWPFRFGNTDPKTFSVILPRRRDRYECDVPHTLPLDDKYHMFCSHENKQKRVYKNRRLLWPAKLF